MHLPLLRANCTLLCLATDVAHKNTIIEENSPNLNEKFTKYNFHSSAFKWILSGYCARRTTHYTDLCPVPFSYLNIKLGFGTAMAPLVYAAVSQLCELNAFEHWLNVKLLNEFPKQNKRTIVLMSESPLTWINCMRACSVRAAFIGSAFIVWFNSPFCSQNTTYSLGQPPIRWHRRHQLNLRKLPANENKRKIH